MKILSIEIENIASIEHAIIPLETGELSGEPIFLICGETGTGKSTILDAICLALYNKVPRMPQINDKGIDDLRVGDVRNLLRRGTGRGFSRVHFTGNDGQEYCAELTMRRSRNSPTGSLQNNTWTLRKTSTDEVLSDKQSEVTELIESLIGLNFKQFTRTAMLAQNQFAQFLKAGESEKAEILEMLTGTDIYSHISKAIYSRAESEKNENKLLKMSLGDIQLLTNEEIEAINKEIEKSNEEIARQTKIATEADLSVKWIEAKQKQDEQINKYENELKTTQELLDSEATKEKSNTINIYYGTQEIRATISKNEELQNELSKLKIAQTTATQRFAQLKRNVEELKVAKVKIATAIENTEHQLNTEKFRHETMFENFSTVKTILTTAARYKQNIASAQKQIKQTQAEIEKITEAIDKTTNFIKIKTDEKQNKKLIFEAENKKLESYDIAKTRERHTEFNAVLSQIKNAQFIVGQLNNEQQQLQEHTRNSKETQEAIAKLEIEIAQDEKLLAAKETELNDAAKQLEYNKLSAADFTRQLRVSLADGLPCPVCGSTQHNVKPEDFFDKLLEEKKQEVERIKTEHDNLKKSIDSKRSQYVANKLHINNLNKSIENDNKKISKLKTDLEAAIKNVGDSQQTDLDQAKLTVEQQIAQINTRLAEAAEIEKTTKNLRAEIDKQDAEIEQLKQKLQENNINITKHKSELANEQCNIKNHEAELQNQTDEADKLISIDHWQEAWEQKPEQFIADAEATAKEWKELKTSLEQNKEKLKNASEYCQTSETLIEKIHAICPEWKEVEPAVENDGDVKHTNDTLAELRAEIDRTLKSTDETAKRIALNDNEITDFIKVYNQQNENQLSAERLKEISRLKQSEIEEIKAQIENIKQQLVQNKTQIEMAKSQLTEHEKSPNKPADGQTVETLLSTIATAKETAEHTNKTRIELGTKIEQHKNESARAAKLQKEIEQSDKALSYWVTLQKYFGSSDGSKFRKIAQSYTLRFLLDKANLHLKKINQRYSLDCEAGSLAIVVIDNYMGGRRRAATTLSGGESFIVSLALALALSSLTDRNIKMETLFIDEGFGTLSPGYLSAVTTMLEQLRHMGCKVGIISHVAELKERIPAQIQLIRRNNSTSDVRIVRNI